MSGIYERLKDDLGCLQLAHAAETFATLAETAQQHDWTHLQFLAELIGDQANATRDRRMTARLRYARFSFRRTIDEFDFFQPSVDRKLIDDLATLRFVDDGRPILFPGQPGCGKTHLAVALALIAPDGWQPATRTALRELEHLKPATLIIWGRNDPLGGPEAARQVAQAIPDSRLELLDAGHGPWLGHPETVARLVEEFVTAR